MPAGMAFLSAALGWIYTTLWTLSVYPIPLNNIRRRSTEGISIDYSLLNHLGMVAYTFYNIALAFSATVRRQYAERNPESPTPIVQPNDVAYAIHGLVIATVVYSQFYPRLWGFDTSRPSKISRWCSLVISGCLLITLFGVSLALYMPASRSWMMLDVVYLVGNFKTFLTLLKYIPQAWLNYQRKSTQGLPLLPFGFDIVGALLSLLQLVIDSAYSEQSAMFANPVKLFLANITMFFDLVFFFQRFVLYKKTVDEALAPKLVAERQRLLEMDV